MICLKQNITVDVQGCTNALKYRMSEKGHPEHSSLIAIGWHHDIPFILNIRRSLLSTAPRHTVHPEHSSLIAIHGTTTYRSS
jgi:hypothetical protein